jgi:kinesin family protein 3/17
VEQKYNNIKEEIDIKTNKLNTLIEKIQEAIQQKQEIQDYRLREKDILLEENRNLIRELKLLDLIIDNFIPQDEVGSLNSKLQYDQDQNEWYMRDDIH